MKSIQAPGKNFSKTEISLIRCNIYSLMYVLSTVKSVSPFCFVRVLFRNNLTNFATDDIHHADSMVVARVTFAILQRIQKKCGIITAFTSASFFGFDNTFICSFITRR